MFKKQRSWHPVPSLHSEQTGETMETATDFIFLGSKITADGVCSHKIKKTLVPWKKGYDKPRQHIKKQRHYFANKVPYRQSYGFSSSHVWMWELDDLKKLSAKELMLLNFCAGEDSWESLGLQDQTSQSWRKSVLNIHWKDWFWSWSSNTLTSWCEKPTLWKRSWCWERLKAGEVDDRGGDGWMTSLTQCTWAWENSRRWWRTGKPVVVQSMGLQRVRYDWVTE